MWVNPLGKPDHLQIRSMFDFIERETASCNLEDATCCVRCLFLCHGFGKAKHPLHRSSYFVGEGMFSLHLYAWRVR